MSLAIDDGRRGFDGAVLGGMLALDIGDGRLGVRPGSKKGVGHHTRHTTVPQRRHSETMSRAHSPALVSLGRRASSMYQRLVARARNCIVVWGSTGTCSLEQCSVETRSILRYCSTSARIWRHVRDRLSSVLRSIQAAMDMMMLGCVHSAFPVPAKGSHEKRGHLRVYSQGAGHGVLVRVHSVGFGVLSPGFRVAAARGVRPDMAVWGLAILRRLDVFIVQIYKYSHDGVEKLF